MKTMKMEDRGVCKMFHIKSAKELNGMCNEELKRRNIMNEQHADKLCSIIQDKMIKSVTAYPSRKYIKIVTSDKEFFKYTVDVFAIVKSRFVKLGYIWEETRQRGMDTSGTITISWGDSE